MEMLRETLNFFYLLREQSGAAKRSSFFFRGIVAVFKHLFFFRVSFKREPSDSGNMLT